MSLTEAFSTAAALYPSLKPNEYIQMTCDVYLARMRDDDTPAQDARDKVMVSENVFFLYGQSTRLVFGTFVSYTVKDFYSDSAENVDGDVPKPPMTFKRSVKIIITEDPSYVMAGRTKLVATMGNATVRFDIDNPGAAIVTDNENSPAQIKMLEMKNFKVTTGKYSPLPN